MIQDIDNETVVAGVYIILHTASGKAYVGESYNVKMRWASHFKELNKNNHGNRYLQYAWNKHGATEFEFKLFLAITEDLSRNELKKKLKFEEARILKLFPDHYNLADAGEGYLTMGVESIAKMAIGIKKAWEREEYRSLLVARAKAERNTPEGRARMKRVRLDAMANPEAVLNHKLATKAAWQNPEIKASRVESFNTPEGKQNRAKGAALGWEKRREKLKNDKEFLERHKESRAQANKKIKELYNTPEGKAKLSEQARQTWQIINSPANTDYASP